MTAHNVRARLEYEHADGIDTFKINPGGWIISGGEQRRSCSTGIDLASGEMQKLILLSANEKGEAQTIKVEGNMRVSIGPGKISKYGDWTIRGTIAGDNCEPLEIAYTFHIGDEGVVQSLRRVDSQ